MARARKVVQVPPAEAVFILEAMISDGNVLPDTLEEYRARYVSEIQTLEARLARLRDLATPIVPAAAVGAAIAAAVPAVVRKVRQGGTKVAAKVAKLTPERILSRKLQGRYLGLMRQIPKNVVQSQFGKEAIASKGKEAVIDEMEAYIAAKGGSEASPKRRSRRARGGRAAKRSSNSGGTKKRGARKSRR